MSTLRLLYPQWQGGLITALVPELSAQDATLGYALGAQILDLLAPKHPSHQSAIVPVSLEGATDRTPTNGISNWDAIQNQTKAALKILDQANPERILTLGGECAVSVAPFTWLINKYGPDTAIVWIDAHPDINQPGDPYTGYHAMALGACLGKCGAAVTSLLPATTTCDRALLVGVCDYDVGIKDRAAQYQLKTITSTQLRTEPDAVVSHLRAIKAGKVVIHFDLDALDPSELFVAVGRSPDGLKVQQVVDLINGISANFDVVGLTVAEPMPKTAIALRNLLQGIKLFQE